MSVERAVQRTIEGEHELVRDAAAQIPKAWGMLAARGVVAFRVSTGRAPTDAERRAIWSGLWQAVERMRVEPRPCVHVVDPKHHATCEVCGVLLCIACARTHLCTSECAERGCVAGLCVKEVRDGIVADTFGID